MAAFSSQAFAGFIEVGASGNYRRSTINADNFQESISFTGSVSYYFWDQSALEFSYTDGYSQVVTAQEGGLKRTTETEFEMIGVDLVFGFGDRQAAFQPYIKGGAARISRKIAFQTEGQEKVVIPASDGIVPSAGVGMKVRLTKTFSLKFGVDAWTTPPSDDDADDPTVVDYAGRAGISWLF